MLKDPGAESNYASSLALNRIQEQETRLDVFNGNSVRASFAAGTRIRIIKVPEQKQEERITFEEERDYLITSVTFSATELGYTDDKAGDIVAKLLSDAAIAGALRGLDRFDDAQKNNMPDINKVFNSLPAMPNVMAAFGVGFMGPWLWTAARLGVAISVRHTGAFRACEQGAEAAALFQYVLLRADRRRSPVPFALRVARATRAGSADRDGLWSHR